MKKILILSLMLLPLTLLSQFTLNGAIKNNITLSHTGNVYDGIRIKSRIPFLTTDDQIGILQVTIRNMYDNSIQSLQFGWSVIQGNFSEFVCSGNGTSVIDRAIISEESGFIYFYIPGEYERLVLNITATVYCSQQDQTWLDNWEADDALVTSGNYVDAYISNQFTNMGVSSLYATDIYAYRLNNTIANITNLTVSNTLSATDIEVKKEPALNQQDIARINLTNRNASNGFYSWGIYTGATAGGLGVTSNGLDIWEYPDWGNWTTGTYRQRFIMHPSQKNGVNDFKPFVINPNGSVAIGFDNGNIAKSVSMNNSSSGDYMLFVNGNVKAKKLRITTTASEWADYVFEPNYKLRSLQSLEEFINENKHLPDVPTAEEIGKEGQDVGNMQVILLKKIEELTLYLIQQNKQLEEQDKKIRELTSELLILKAAR